MLTGRRTPHARHEFRFGTREIVVFCGAFLVVWGLTFAFGVLVGRELGSSGSGGGKGTGSNAASAERARASKPAAAASEERLTFYQTLTAPTPHLPGVRPPQVEERLVPEDPAPAKPPGKPERRAVTASTPSTGERGGTGRAVAAASPREAPAPSTAAQPTGAGPAEPQLWTVQVSSFRSRALAEELRGRLQTRGFDAYLLSMSTEEGRVRHRVRVGAFTTRGEAERVVNELRSERSLNPFVTTRTR